MSLELAIGHYLRLTPPGASPLCFQNYHIDENVLGPSGTAWPVVHTFLPFGFSGLTANRRGDNSETLLTFPNNELSRAWAMDAIRNAWLVDCTVMLIDPDTRQNLMMLTTYTGQVASGTWDDTALVLRVDSILDAVGFDVPARQIHSSLVGRLPITAQVNF